jgi:hypothetical protein
MNRHFDTGIFISALSLFFLLVISCAEPSMPQGGPEDIQAPRLNKKKYSTPNKATNFRDNQIILTFDEWIKLQSTYSQLVISPPLKNKPEVKIRNKSVVLKWNEPLKDSTTYTISFGDAVRDITENNITQNLKFVFSTGPFLDSLNCSGQLVDAESGSPLEGALVMLYQNLEDSIPLSQKPYYFSKTDKQGAFKIENIQNHRYRIFALTDKNSDYKYNLADEKIAFLDSSFLLNDSLQPFIKLSMFKEREQTIVFSSKMPNYGHIKLVFNNQIQSVSTISLINASDDFKYVVDQGNDTLSLWFDGIMPDDDQWLFIVENEVENLLDTISINSQKRNDFEEFAPGLIWCTKNDIASSISRSKQDTASVRQHPLKPVELFFIRPIQQFDSLAVLLFIDTLLPITEFSVVELTDSLTGDVRMDTLIKKVLRDTFLKVQSPKISVVSNVATQLNFNYNWIQNRRYKIMILPNALTDFFGFENKDTLSGIYSINNIIEYGSVSVNVINADSSMQYIVQLLDSKAAIVQQNIIRDSSQINILYENIKTGNYSLKIIHDLIRNKRWDSGLYIEKKQAELISVSKTIVLKPGWENFMEMDIGIVD